MPWIICPHCTKRELVPLAICESWSIAASIHVPAIGQLWFLNCSACDSTNKTYAFMRRGVGTKVRLHDNARHRFELLNQEALQDFDYCCIKESHDYCRGFHVYLATNETGGMAVVLDSWLQCDNQTLTLTSGAAEQFLRFLNGRPTNYREYIRLSAKIDEHSQFIYSFELNNGPILESDWVYDRHGFQIAIDAESWPYVRGRKVDWQVDSHGNAGFKLNANYEANT